MTCCTNVRLDAHHAPLSPWQAPWLRAVVAASTQLPLVSGLYRLAHAALSTAPDCATLTPEDLVLLRAYLRDVAVASRSLQGEERAAALELQLAAPPTLLPREAVLPAVCAALRAGLQHPPLAEAAVGALEAWERDGWGNEALQGKVASQVAPLLAPLLGNIASWADAVSGAELGAAPEPVSSDKQGEGEGGEGARAGARDGVDALPLKQGSRKKDSAARQRAQHAEVCMRAWWCTHGTTLAQVLRLLQPRVQLLVGRMGRVAASLAGDGQEHPSRRWVPEDVVQLRTCGCADVVANCRRTACVCVVRPHVCCCNEATIGS